MQSKFSVSFACDSEYEKVEKDILCLCACIWFIHDDVSIYCMKCVCRCVCACVSEWVCKVASGLQRGETAKGILLKAETLSQKGNKHNLSLSSFLSVPKTYDQKQALLKLMYSTNLHSQILLQLFLPLRQCTS